MEQDLNFRDPQYLGDGVYVGHDGSQLWLRTGTHLNIYNQIALEPNVIKSLNDYAKRQGYVE